MNGDFSHEFSVVCLVEADEAIIASINTLSACWMCDFVRGKTERRTIGSEKESIRTGEYAAGFVIREMSKLRGLHVQYVVACVMSDSGVEI